MKKLKLVGILAAVVLIGSVISIPLINNHTAYKVEKSLCETHTCSSKLKCTEENPSTLIIIHVGACTMIVFRTSA